MDGVRRMIDEVRDAGNAAAALQSPATEAGSGHRASVEARVLPAALRRSPCMEFRRASAP